MVQNCVFACIHLTHDSPKTNDQAFIILVDGDLSYISNATGYIIESELFKVKIHVKLLAHVSMEYW